MAVVYGQESTDAAPEEPYPRPTRPDTATRERRHCPRVRPRLATCLFFFFSRLAPTLLRLGPIRAESGRHRPYRAKRPIQAMAEAAAAASPFCSSSSGMAKAAAASSSFCPLVLLLLLSSFCPSFSVIF